MKLQKIYHAFTCRTHGSYESVGIEFFNEDGEILYWYTGGIPSVKFLMGPGRPPIAAAAFTQKYGITPKNLHKIIKGVVLKHVVKAHPEWDKLFTGCMKRSWDHGSYFHYIEYEPEMQQCRKDGIPHIIPLVGNFGKSPKELKEHFGSSNWKKICKNTYSRNKLLSKTSLQFQVDINILNARSSVLQYGGDLAIKLPQS